MSEVISFINSISEPEAVRAYLKWFNVPKGFGFVIPENEPVDAFLHATTLRCAGVDALGENACLLVRIERGEKGHHVSEVVSVMDAGEQPVSINPQAKPQEETIELTGIVKWYHPQKGFGFVRADDGKKDVFLHSSCLKRRGLETIQDNTPVLMIVRNVAKGREVVEFDFLDQ